MARGYGMSGYGKGLYQGGDLVVMGASGHEASPTGRVTAGKDAHADAYARVIASGFMLLDVFSPLAAMGYAIHFAWAEVRRTTDRALSRVDLISTGHITGRVRQAAAGAALSTVNAYVLLELTWESEAAPVGEWDLQPSADGDWQQTFPTHITWT